ncbi:MAG TPA: hypothetical protein VF508_01310, partial [Pyrinomonadaceae bacterium]
LLREAEAALPADAPAAEANARAAGPDGEDETTIALKPVAVRSDEVDIFSRKGDGRGARLDAAVPDTSTQGTPFRPNVSTGAALSSDTPAAAASPKVSRPVEPASDLFVSESAAGVSLRLDGREPVHPSASTFRLGGFLRSWQGSVGTALLLLAFGVAVFALMRGGSQRQPAPAATAATPLPQQASAPTPAPTPFTTPTPGFPTPDALGVVPVGDPAYAMPNGSGQPFYVPQPAPGPVPADVPRDLTVVSESGVPAGEEAGRNKRKSEAGANESAPAQANTRNAPPADTDTRPARPARTPEPEQRAAPPAPNPPPAATPQPTPGRAKVIPWPPE